MKYFLIYLLSSIILLASDVNQHQVKILETIMQKISLDSRKFIWSDNTNLLNELGDNHVLNVVKDCQSANLIILEKNIIPVECKNKYIFVLNYQLLIDLPESFGAMFWKKGRPNIIILEPRINAQSIKTQEELNPYLEEKIW